MKSTRKQKTTNKRTQKAKIPNQIYASDRYETYSIHKATIISFDPVKSCKQIQLMFGSSVGKIHDPPDANLKKRGIKWVRFNSGGKAEFHFVPPFKLKDDRTLKKIVKRQTEIDPLKSQFFENHVGIYVPDLTPVIVACLKNKIRCHLNRRADGMYQFYVQIDGCLDYLDVDSLKINFDKIKTIDPDFRAFTFEENSKNIHKYEKEFLKTMKNNSSTKTELYLDPKHEHAPRKIYYLKNNKLKIVGRDKPTAKNWVASGTVDKNKNMVIDLSSKGGPKNIKAKVTKQGLLFEDNNLWESVHNI